jgi:adenylate cyclase
VRASAASRLPVVGWIFPDPDEAGSSLLRRLRVSLIASLTAANLVGAGVVFAFASVVLPLPEIADPGEAGLVSGIALACYMLAGVLIGTWWALRKTRPAIEWLVADREPTADERRLVLRAPRMITFVHGVLWSLAALVFGGLNAAFSLELGQRVLITVLLGGLTTCAIVYLVCERQLRPAAARALAGGLEDRRLAPGIRTRSFLAWALGSAVPVVGVMLVALSTLVEHDFSETQLAVTVLVLGGVALAVGLLVAMLAARAVADPVRSLRQGVRSVEEGDLEVEVPVYDGSEIGQLQAGFNQMVAGLRERERIHDLFGRHVGEDVARAALEQEVELGGETRDVSALFVDVVGSTRMASERPAHEVVELLNSFFSVVVEVVREHGGWVNKFEGDAALAIFGAPVPLPDHATRALRAARALHSRLESGIAGIGVSCGEVVAGNIGEVERFEYTVIGDPVNEAARLTELAKSRGGVLASESIVRSADDDEAARWQLGESVELRGRSASTQLATPRS